MKPNHSLKLNVLCERYSTVAGKRYLYRLYATKGTETPTRFFISISGNGEYREERVSDDLTEATRSFCAVSDGGVTPCVLKDVLQDLLFQYNMVKNG